MANQDGFVFIGYSRRDEDVMRKIVVFLRSNGIRVWVDNEKLVPGTPVWEAEIEKALRTCSAMVVLLSPDAKQSVWVRRELSFAESYGKRIYPILVRGDSKSSLPLRLITSQFIDMRSESERALETLATALRGPFEVFSKSEKTLDTYKRDIEKSSTRPILEAKIVLVGQGSVGKTSLVNKLLYNQFYSQEAKTEGISIDRWEVIDQTSKKTDAESRQKIRVNVWDFGGQEIMHATHQFFLTKRSIYLLVLDSRLGQDENRVEYWLQLIQSFGGDSPVIIVGNKSDQQALDIDQRGLMRKYPNITGIVETSCLKDVGISKLKKMLSREISALQHVHDELPTSWFVVKDKIASLDSDYIEYKKYQEICEQNEVSEKNSQDSLVSFLHDLGVIVYFQDDPRLKPLGVLNPEWVTNGVYRILNSHELFQNKGVLDSRYLGQILNTDTYSHQHQLFILDVMQKFELCFKFDGNSETTYLVPDILPREEAYTGNWQDALEFEFHYPILPSSIISRFIVRMHPYIHQKTVWRAGVVLKKDDTIAFIKADYEDNKIYIRVIGGYEERRDFLATIRGTIEAIRETIPGLNSDEKIPVPGYPKADLQKYADLLLHEYNGRENISIVVDGAIVDMDIGKILDQIEDKSARILKTESLPFKPVKLSRFQKTIKLFNTTPRYIGRFVFDVFGREKVAVSSTIILGYILIVIVTLSLFGIFNIDQTIEMFKYNWRFFFPEK